MDPRPHPTEIAVCDWLVQQRHDRLQRPLRARLINRRGVLPGGALDMPSSSANFERPFHRNVYDRAIGGSLAEKFRTAQHLFVDDDGHLVVPAYFGGDFVADVEKASTATTIRAVDEALTAPCFGSGSASRCISRRIGPRLRPKASASSLIMNAATTPSPSAT